MPDLNFRISGVEVPPHAATPQLHFMLNVANVDASEPIHSVILQCQIQLETTKRSYTPDEKEKLRDLFGEPDRWGQTLRNTLWTHAQVTVSAFTGSTEVSLAVTCTYDLNVVGTKYFYALDSGDVPLLFLFSGTVFYAAEDGRLQATQIAWNKEASFSMPVSIWQDMIATYYPGTAFVVLQKDTFDRLYEFKRLYSLPTWEHAIERLLDEIHSDESAPT
jgi:hypothetical protein